MNLPQLWSRIERHHKANVAVRSVLAVPVAYLVASQLGSVLARGLPMKPVDASMTAVLVSTVALPLLSMWSFGAATAARAAVTLLGAALVLGAWLSVI